MALETVFIIGSYGLVTLSVNTHREMQECTIKKLVKKIQDSLPHSLPLSALVRAFGCNPVLSNKTNHRNNPVALTPPNLGLMLNCSFSCVSVAFLRCGGSAGGRCYTSIMDLLISIIETSKI